MLRGVLPLGLHRGLEWVEKPATWEQVVQEEKLVALGLQRCVAENADTLEKAAKFFTSVSKLCHRGLRNGLLRYAHQSCAFRLLVSMIGRPHQRAAFYVAEAHLQGLALDERELVRRVITRYGQMVFGWAQVLAYGKNVDFAGSEVAEDIQKFLHSLADAHHQSRF